MVALDNNFDMNLDVENVKNIFGRELSVLSE